MTSEVVLITGASGFIGRALLEFACQSGLTKTYQIIALASQELPGWHTVVVPRNADEIYTFGPNTLKDLRIDRVDYLIHLGGYTPKSGDQVDNIPGNIATTLNTWRLLEVMPSILRKIVLASTLDVYEPSTTPITEATPVGPSSLYGHSKLFCEALLASVVRPGGPRAGTALQILRLGHVYGPGEEAYKKFIPTSINRIINGAGPRLLTAGTERRAFIHVRDCCKMIFRALRTPDGVGPINVASARAISIRDIAEIISSAGTAETGHKVEVEYAASPLPGRDVIFDVSKMMKFLGIESEIIEQGIVEQFRWALGKRQ